MTTAEAAALAASVGQAILGFILLTLLPALLRWAADQRTQACFAAVTRAGKVGALAAAVEVRHALELAVKPESPGGATITPEEMRAAIGVGVAAAKASLREQLPRLFDQVVRIYGGEAALDDRLKTLVTTMVKDHVG